jgi:indolepyruvate ferredoxin oxidoreductase alpha subunit
MSVVQKYEVKVLLGNEAIAYGAAEYGVDFASAYPGTPSTEIIETLFRLSDIYGFYVEWSVNEKVALEAAYGAALAGVNSITVMKHVGLNVAMDPLTTSAYTGVEGSFVIVSADDPDMWSSQNEQDNRWFGIRSYIPVLEPGSVMEVKDLVAEAFKLSRSFGHPVIYRTTTRLSHSRAPFKILSSNRERRRGMIIKNPRKYSVIPAHARVLRRDMLKRWDDIEDYLNHFKFNWFEGDGDSLIITSGSAYGILKDVLDILKLRDIRILKLSGLIPLPRGLIKEGLEAAERVLIIEELDPVLETMVKSYAYDEGFNIEIVGKSLVPQVGELDLNKVGYAVSRFFGVDFPYRPLYDADDLELPSRPPVLCAGCPHRGSFYALRKAVSMAKVKAIYNGDIGCYSLGVLPPFQMQDTIVEMGGSIGLANGYAQVLSEGELPIAIIGDSTFFHSGITPLVNAVYNKAPMLVLILDNRITAMTGGQPHPGTGYYQDGSEAPHIDLIKLVKGIGVEYVVKFDPFDIDSATHELYRALEYVKKNRMPAVVIAERSCTLHVNNLARINGIEIPLYKVLEDRCTACGVCYNAFSCPAIIPLENGKAYIDEGICVGCGKCRYVCPYDAFVVVRGWSREYLALWR